MDPALAAAASLACGAAASVAPGATLLAAGLVLALLARRLAPAALALAAACLALGWGRASWLLAEHARSQGAARAALPAPARCAAAGRVTSSPTLVGGSLRFDAELGSLDCDGTLDPRIWPTRLYLPQGPHHRGPQPPRPTARRSPPPSAASPTAVSPSAPSQSADVEAATAEGGALVSAVAVSPALARGDLISVIADLAPVSEFRNFDLPDPRPGAARQRVVLSGKAQWLEVEQPGRGAAALVDRVRAHVRERISATFGSTVAGMARALVLGENDLTPDDARAFQRSGLSHLLAVSGTHLILAVLALVRGLEAVLRRWPLLSARADVRRLAAWVGLCLGPMYADFAGGSGSARRAAWMLGAVLAVRILGRHVFTSRVLAASLVLGWLDDGLVVFDTSFSLSIAATAGLLAMGRRRDERALARAATLTQPRAADFVRLLGGLAAAAQTTLAATLPCVPILLSISPGLSLASVAANLLAAPLGEAVALPLCLAHALCSALPALERGIAVVASGALMLIRGVALASASIDWLYVELPPPTEWQLAGLAASVAAWLAVSGQSWLDRWSRTEPASRVAHRPPTHRPPTHRPPTHRPPARHPSPPRERLAWVAIGACAAGLSVLEAAACCQHSAAHGRALQRLRVTALDVGQGDAILVDLPDGRLMLIDGGGFVGVPIDPGERVILPTLRARRRSRIDILVLTHPHPDHFGGLSSVVREVDIGEFWYGGPDADLAPRAAGDGAPPSLPPSALHRLLELLRARGVPMRSARDLCPVLATAAGATLRVLHPCPAFDDAQELNDNSLVLRIAHGAHAALLVGDAEHWAEQQMVATAAELRADFLKVGHHGSRTSSSASFLAHVEPRFAAISSGVRNRFGHPHPETLTHLERAGADILRIDRRGAIEWQSNGREQRTRSVVDTEPTDPAPTRARRVHSPTMPSSTHATDTAEAEPMSR